MIEKRDQTEREKMMELDFEHWNRVFLETGHVPCFHVRKMFCELRVTAARHL
jgi:hypothetical protein